MARALQIHHTDNVAVVLAAVTQGEEVVVTTERGLMNLKAKGDIPFGHKISLYELRSDAPIIKYGEEIGKAGSLIPMGEWVHLHNVYCERGRKD